MTIGARSLQFANTLSSTHRALSSRSFPRLFLPSELPHRRERPIMSKKTHEAHNTGLSDLSSADARWLELKQISYIDETGKERKWEVARRKTTAASGVDAVAIGNIIFHPARPPSTMLVLQYRPPMGRTTVEWPAGLVDANETAEEAAVREFREETGYQGRVLSVGPEVASDPGMTASTLQLVMMEVRLKEGDEEPEQHLDDGEHIERVVVPIDELYERLMWYSNQKGMIVAAKLFNFAAGMQFAKQTLVQ